MCCWTEITECAFLLDKMVQFHVRTCKLSYKYLHSCSSRSACVIKLKFHWDQFPRNFLVTSWRLPRNISYGEVTGKLVPVEFELQCTNNTYRGPQSIN